MMADGDVGCCCNVINNVFIHYFSIFLTSHRLADTGLECLILVCRKSAVGLPTVGVPYVNSKQPPPSCNYFKFYLCGPKTKDQQPQRTAVDSTQHLLLLANNWTVRATMIFSDCVRNETYIQTNKYWKSGPM